MSFAYADGVASLDISHVLCCCIIAFTISHQSVGLDCQHYILKRTLSILQFTSLSEKRRCADLLIGMHQLQEAKWKDIGIGTATAVALQLTLGMPFLLQHPTSYITKAFEFSRVFLYKWSVNWRFVPESIFLSKPFATALLGLHVSLLLLFAHFKWCKPAGGLYLLLARRLKGQAALPDRSSYKMLEPSVAKHMLMMLFSANLIGISCARTLHFQFYSWYFHTLPFLLWQIDMWTPLRLMILFYIEIVWNVFPSTAVASLLLFCCHCIVLAKLWQTPHWG